MMNALKTKATVAATYLREIFPGREVPAFFVQTGSGFRVDSLLDEVDVSLPLSDLPHMPDAASPPGHALRLLSGWTDNIPMLVCAGRRHLYEGFGTLPCVLPVCAAGLAGISSVVLIAAAGGVNPDYSPGTVMVLTDYINNLGTSPLVGTQALGSTFFPAMHEAYSPWLTSSFLNVTAPSPLSPRVGTYQANLGPQYETPAEVEIARRNGADAVGMSTVLETIAARALSMEVLGLALITNTAASVAGAAPVHSEVRNLSAKMSPEIVRLLRKFFMDLTRDSQ